ncbi:MAG: FGGY-family carbohydrate kinase [Novosphingobium sp.]
MPQGAYITVDLGKTHGKITLWSRDGQCVDRYTRANDRLPAAPFAPLDAEANAHWVLETLGRFAGHPVEAIVPVTHGAAVVAVRDGELVCPPMDYEWDIPATILAEYRQQRSGFGETGSPALPCGLNFGAQLHYLEQAGLLSGATLMPYAQYWAWLLSGVAVSEATSLGCHSDLWAPTAGDYSALAKSRGWADQFAPLAKAGDVIGTLRPDIAAKIGLSPTIKIYAGLHDSNAALHAARGFPEIAANEATVLSTGTWFISMRLAGQALDIASLPEDRDCLVNVDVFGHAVPSARFMGGRELDILGARIDHDRLDGLSDVLHTGAMALPSQLRGCGPFPDSVGRLIEWPDDEAERSAAATLYAALMTDASLDLIGSKDRLLIEGRFARSALFTRALASLRPDTKVYTASAEADVSFGALRLAAPHLVPPGTVCRVEPLDRDLNAYRDAWYDAIDAFA